VCATLAIAMPRARIRLSTERERYAIPVPTSQLVARYLIESDSEPCCQYRALLDPALVASPDFAELLGQHLEAVYVGHVDSLEQRWRHMRTIYVYRFQQLYSFRELDYKSINKP
jgi:hypothetical protein